jgi:asparagine synthase (glutamine-hydrolysing)
VAEALQARLVERYRDPRRVDVGRSEAWRLPRPTARSFGQDSTRLAAETAAECGAGAIIDGGGGDNLFCSLQSARPAADCLLSEAAVGRFWSTAETIAQLAQTATWRVAWHAWRMKQGGCCQYRWPLDRRFLSPDAIRASAGAAAHPWLSSPGGALPGKAAHVALVAAAQSVAEGYDAEDELTLCSPLISQPLVEACLQVPSWLWYEEGLNRAVARRAFAAVLPEQTVRRRSKGAPDGFVAEIYAANRGTIRTMLLQGWLSRQGLLDLGALASALHDPGPVRGHDFLRIMQLVDAEAWARSWT